MTSKARKRNINLALKVAIVQSGKASRAVAHLAKLGEVRLSAIVHGRIRATPDEQKAIARVLRVEVAAIFPQPPAALPTADHAATR